MSKLDLSSGCSLSFLYEACCQQKDSSLFHPKQHSIDCRTHSGSKFEDSICQFLDSILGKKIQAEFSEKIEIVYHLR